MQVVVDSKKFDDLLKKIDGMFLYEEAADQYDGGVRDGRNEAVSEVKSLLSEFWTIVLSS